MAERRDILKHSDISPVGSNSLGTSRIPPNGTKHAVYLRVLNSSGVELPRSTIISEISEIKVIIDGDVYMEGTPTFWLDRQKFYGDVFGAGNVDGIIPIEFTLPHLESDPERRVFGWGMADVNSLTVQVQFGTVSSVAQVEVSSLSSKLEQKLGRHLRIRKYPQNFTSTGVQELDNLPRKNGGIDYLALHVEEGSGQIDKVNIEVNDINIFDEVVPKLNQALLEIRKRTPQSGYFHVDFGMFNDLGSVLSMAGINDFRQEFTWNVSAGAPGVYNIYAEQIHPGKDIK